jgi:nucleotide-binding universal stress UspA family protein
MGYRKILLAVDFSEASRLALREAADLAAKFGAELTIAHVRQGPTLSGLGERIDDDRFLPSRHAAEDQLLDEWKQEALQRSERPVRALHLDGVPDVCITTQARDGDYELVVLGSHGKGALAHVLVGSVAEKVIRHAPCPVFVVRAKTRR